MWVASKGKQWEMGEFRREASERSQHRSHYSIPIQTKQLLPARLFLASDPAFYLSFQEVSPT